jgi:hypothetical protein
MPRLTGTIVVGGAAAEGAYVQIQNLAGTSRPRFGPTPRVGSFCIRSEGIGAWCAGCRAMGGRNRRSRWAPRT